MPEQESHFTQADRNLIIKLDYQATRMADDIKNLAFSVANSDHEKRIRDLEKGVDDFALVKKIVFGLVSLILVGFAGAIIAIVIK